MLHKGDTLPRLEAFNHHLLVEKCFLVISTIDVISILHVSRSSRRKTTHRSMSVSFLLPQTADKMLGLGSGLQGGGADTEAASEGEVR